MFQDGGHRPELALTLGALDIDDINQLKTLLEWI